MKALLRFIETALAGGMLFLRNPSFKARVCLFVWTAALAGCITTPPPPQWNPVAEAAEAEYQAYLKAGTGTVAGRASLANRFGAEVKAAGRIITLDPATSVGKEWWGKAGRIWIHHSLTPPSPAFARSRRMVVAGADGRFKFSGLPPGEYYVRTEITWKIANYGSIQGGLVGQAVEVRDGQVTEVILNQNLESTPK
jgi:hypothetical protein